MPFAKIFRSRWSALFWAAGILWTAADVALSQPADGGNNSQAAASTDVTGEMVDNSDLAVLANAISAN